MHFLLRFSLLLIGSSAVCGTYTSTDLLSWLATSNLGRSVLEHAMLNADDNEDLCLAQVRALLTAANAKELWALKLLDAWGKFPSGLLYGRFVDMGNYDLCLTAAAAPSRYCLSSIPFENLVDDAQYTVPLNVRIGTCMPAACNISQLDAWLKGYLGELFTATKIESNYTLTLSTALVADISCTAMREQPYTALDWFAIAVLIVLILLVIGCTVVDCLVVHSGGKTHAILGAFSLRINLRQLFHVSTVKSSPNVIPCLHGIRCLSLIWIIFGHDYMFLLLSPTVNALEMIAWAQSWFSMILQSGAIAVDTFFFLSGMLLVLVSLRDMKKMHGKLNVSLMYAHRYLRLTPVLALAVLLFVTLFRHAGNGPIWQEFTSSYQLCEQTWWATLLYVQNYAAAGKMCLGHSWYLAVDMQLFLISPIFLIALYKWHWKAIIGIVIFSFLLAACLFSIVMLNQLQVFSEYGNLGEDSILMRKTYYTTHARALPWLIGLLFGYYLHCRNGRRATLSKLVVASGWLLSIATILAVLYAVYPKTQPGAMPITPLSGAFYLTLSRVGWPLALCWVVYACINGYAEPANTFLSWSLWQTISKLSYCMYIWHLLVEMVNAGRIKTNTHFSNYDAMLRFWGDFGITLLLSTFMYLTIEAPMVGIEKFLFSSKKKESTNHINNNNNKKDNLECSKNEEFTCVSPLPAIMCATISQTQ